MLPLAALPGVEGGWPNGGQPGGLLQPTHLGQAHQGPGHTHREARASVTQVNTSTAGAGGTLHVLCQHRPV